MISNRTSDGSEDRLSEFKHRVNFVVATLLAVIALLLCLWFQIRVLLLGFTGLLLAVFLYSIADWIRRRFKWPYWLSLLITCIFLLAVLAGTVWLIEWRVSEQVDDLRTRLPAAWAQVKAKVPDHGWIRWMTDQMQTQVQMLPSQSLVGHGIGFLTRMGRIVTDTFVVLFVGLFLAISPGLYIRGTMHLVPQRHRARARELMSASAGLIWWWLIGQLVAMAFIGVLTGLVVWMLGVPLALTLGIAAALLNFIPNFGPIVAAVPAALLAMMQGPMTAVWVLLAYLVIQALQNHVVMPLVQQEAVSLPPVILILSQIFMYYWAGLLGMALAPPLAALAIMFVEKLYVRATLNDPMNDTKGFWPNASSDEAPAQAEES
jgi:predicted PurR-regulated permease PerM